MTRFLAFIFILNISNPVFANDGKDKGFLSQFKGFIFDDASPQKLEKAPPKNLIKNITPCITTSPHHHYSIMQSIGRHARNLHNNLNNDIKTFSFQPRFSGLKGPKIIILRTDFTNAVRDHKGSAQEIFHNAHITTHSKINCHTGINYHDYYILHNHIDPYESDHAPLIRSSLKWRNELNLGQYLMGTMSARYALGDNLNKDRNLTTLNRLTPIRQDVIAFQYQNFNLERLMISGFATPYNNLYIAGHVGYLEEMFAGAGAEILYRPFGENFAIGAEAWNTIKRIPYSGSTLATDNNNRQQSYLLNAWYDLPETPVSFGASAGRFLDGDTGVEFKTRWTPQSGWKFDAFATITNEDDTTLGNDKSNLFTGIKLSMPLGQFKLIADQSRAEFDITPLARDKGQRIDNPYPLYDYTDPWSTRNINRYWNEITD